jgi:mannose-1-phosphate guanylyltransferase
VSYFFAALMSPAFTRVAPLRRLLLCPPFLRYGLKLTVSVEEEPLGTAGPLALAAPALRAAGGDAFFVFNSDVTCEYPLAELLAFHRNHGREGTILVTKVDEPSKYGVVVHDEAGRIRHFVEKPQTFVGNHINAGMYCFSPRVLDRIELRPMSIEKEVFPGMAEAGELFAMTLPGYWMDIGQPRDYLTGQGLHLAALRRRAPAELAPAAPGIRGNVLIDATATVGAGCVLGPDVVVGPGCVIEDGVRIARATLLRGTRVCSHALVSGAIIGWGSTLGRWSRVENGAVLGEDVQLADEKCINGAIILPHKGIKESFLKPGEIVM